MTLPPLLERELRVALRKKRPQRRRMQVAAIAVGGTLLFLLVAALTGSRGAGRNLHQLFCLAGAFLLLRTPSLTAGIFAQERRQQTLGLLFLSGLGPTEIFVGKLFSAALVAGTDVLAMFPVLAVPFLIGGVSFKLFVATVCALPNLLLFLLAVSVLASVLTRDDGAALVVACLLTVVICAGTPLIHLAQIHFSSAAWPGWLLLSPAYGPYLVWQGFGAVPWSVYWTNFGITLGWTGLSLAIAAVALRLLWRGWEAGSQEYVRAPDASASDPAARGIGGLWRRGRERCREWVHGDARYRRRLASTWLAGNPFVWLAGRDRQPEALAWMVVGGVLGVWLGCWAAWPARWVSVPNLFLTATLLNVSLSWILHYTAARSLGEARHDGSYELLLTTPLGPSDIVWGQLESLRWHFESVARFVLGVEVLFMLGGLVVRTWTPTALLVYFVIWAILLLWAWSQSRNWRRMLLVMWASLNCGQPARAVWRAAGFNSWSWIWILYNLRFVFGKLQKFPSGSTGEVVLVVMLATIWLAIRLFQWDREAEQSHERECRLAAEFREIVREPVPDPEDKRFKEWNPRERFPWGWALVQQQLHERLVRRQG